MPRGMCDFRGPYIWGSSGHWGHPYDNCPLIEHVSNDKCERIFARHEEIALTSRRIFPGRGDLAMFAARVPLLHVTLFVSPKIYSPLEILSAVRDRTNTWIQLKSEAGYRRPRLYYTVLHTQLSL